MRGRAQAVIAPHIRQGPLKVGLLDQSEILVLQRRHHRFRRHRPGACEQSQSIVLQQQANGLDVDRTQLERTFHRDVEPVEARTLCFWPLPCGSVGPLGPADRKKQEVDEFLGPLHAAMPFLKALPQYVEAGRPAALRPSLNQRQGARQSAGLAPENVQIMLQLQEMLVPSVTAGMQRHAPVFLPYLHLGSSHHHSRLAAWAQRGGVMIGFDVYATFGVNLGPEEFAQVKSLVSGRLKVGAFFVPVGIHASAAVTDAPRSIGYTGVPEQLV